MHEHFSPPPCRDQTTVSSVPTTLTAPTASRPAQQESWEKTTPWSGSTQTPATCATCAIQTAPTGEWKVQDNRTFPLANSEIENVSKVFRQQIAEVCIWVSYLRCFGPHNHGRSNMIVGRPRCGGTDSLPCTVSPAGPVLFFAAHCNRRVGGQKEPRSWQLPPRPVSRGFCISLQISKVSMGINCFAMDKR